MTSVNAARLLSNFFKSDDKTPYDARAILMALLEVESHVDLWESTGSDVTPFRETLPIWRAEVFHFIDNNTGSFRNYQPSGNLHTSSVGMLGWVDERISTSAPQTTEAARESIREIIQNVRNGLIEDKSLPERLRVHVTRILRHVEQALDEYEITGDFLLEDAMERLLGVLGLVEQASKNPSMWQKFKEAFVPGFAAELASSGSMQGMAAITAAITGA